MSHTKRGWVIVFLIYADFRKSADTSVDLLAMTEQMKAELNSLFKDILTVPLNDNRIQMYVIINSIDYKDSNENLAATTVLYKIGNPHNRKCNEIVCCDVISRRDGDFDRPNPDSPVQDPVFLKSIISRIKVREDEEVLFCTHDHGSAFGIFREINPDSLTGEIRRPIQYELEKYPYLAVFWNRALEEDSDFRELVDRASELPSPKLVQIGHSLFRINSVLNNLAESARLVFTTQTSLPVHIRNGNLSAQNLQLIFNGDSNFFEIWDFDLYEEKLEKKELHGHRNIAASLSNEDVTEILHNEELVLVFDHWLKGREVSVLLMMNCWMMNLHTMYSFRNTVKYLVAPQGDIGTPGYNYKDILQYLFTNKGVFNTAEQLALTCIATSENRRMRRRSVRLRADKTDMIDRWKIFAVNLQKKNIHGSIREEHFRSLNEIIYRLLPENQTKPQEAIRLYQFVRLVSHDFSKNGVIDTGSCLIIDIINWLHSLYHLRVGNGQHQPFPIDDETIAKIGQFVSQVYERSDNHHLVVSESRANRVYDERLSVIKLPPTGYSLFFPCFPSENGNLIDNVKKDSLLNDKCFHWRAFIKAIYDPEIWEPFFDD
jgi:hypothetical protein